MGYDYEKVRFWAGGLELVGQLYRTKNVGEAPGVLMLHGGGEGSSSLTFERLQKYLAKQGVSSFAIDYRGCGESEGNFEDGSLDNRLVDAANGLRVLLEKGVQRDKLTVLGMSNSGHVSARLLQRNPWISKLALVCPAAYGLDAEKLLINEESIPMYRQNKKWIGSPVAEILEKFEGKIITFYGENDNRIPADVQKSYMEVSSRKGSVHILRETSHTILNPETKVQEEEMLRAFELISEFVRLH